MKAQVLSWIAALAAMVVLVLTGHEGWAFGTLASTLIAWHPEAAK